MAERELETKVEYQVRYKIRYKNETAIPYWTLGGRFETKKKAKRWRDRYVPLIGKIFKITTKTEELVEEKKKKAV